MVAALLVMLLVGFAMGVTVCEILVARPARKEANDYLRLAEKSERDRLELGAGRRTDDGTVVPAHRPRQPGSLEERRAPGGGNMKAFILAVALVAALLGASASQAATTRSTCSDLSYLTSAVKVAKKNVAALKLGQRSRFAAALVPANAALWMAKHSAEPCDDDGNQYWLHRQYSIRHGVALVRYLEEMKQGDYDRADIYWSSVEFWSDEITDITYGW